MNRKRTVLAGVVACLAAGVIAQRAHAGSPRTFAPSPGAPDATEAALEPMSGTPELAALATGSEEAAILADAARDASEPTPAAVPEGAPRAQAAGTRPPWQDGSLEQIIVTAQKRPEDLQEVPFSLTTVNGRAFDELRAGGLDVQLLSARLPSLTIESSFGRTFPRFYIRGLGNTDFDLNASQPVSMILDDVVLENPTLKGFPLFDLDRVEILRGPQGTLFGRNTPAGIVKFDSRQPTHETSGYGRLTYGQFNFVGVEGAAGGSLVSDVLAARASVLFERRSDWVENTFRGQKNALEGFQDVAGRVQLLFTPSDRLRVLLNAHAHSLDGTARVFRANIIERGSDGKLVRGFDRAKVAHDGRNRQEIDQLGGVLNLQYDLGPVTLTSVSGYETIEVFSRGDIDGGFGAAFAPPSGPGFIPFPSESADGIPRAHQVTEELRIASNAWDVLNFQTGAFYFDERLDIESHSYNTLAGGVENGFARQRQDATAFGLFGTATVDVKRLRLSAGARYNNDKKDFTARRLTSPIGGGPIGPLNARPEDDFVSWDASASYRLAAGLNAYARAARGFRAPSIQGRILFGDALSVADSEKTLSFDAGVKTELFERRARVNLAGFYYRVSDQQLTAVGGASNFNTLLNTDESIGYGFELDTQLAPFKGMFITFGLSMNRTEIRDEGLAIAPCGGGCTVEDPAGPTPGTVLITGNPLPHAPEWIGNLTFRYGVPIAGGSEVFFFTEWAYRSRIHFFLYDSRELTDEELLEGSARLGYSYDAGRAEVAAFVRNVTDDTSLVGGIDFNNLTGFVNEPRFWGVEASYRF